MKIFKLYLLLALSTLVACKEDFDELRDTDQRYVAFEVSTEDFFDDFFNLPQVGLTAYNSKYELDSDYKIRLSCYCYDYNDNLVGKTSLLMPDRGKGLLKIAHLDKDTEYRFDIFADVVKNDKTLEYYESWFHLETTSIDSFLLLNMQKSEDTHHDLIKHATVNVTPGNNVISIRLDPITVNSYCILSNVDSTEWISGEIIYSTSFYVKSLTKRSSKSQEFSYINKGQKDIIIPFNLAAINDTVNFKFRRVMLNKTDSLKLSIINTDNKHMVTTIDCRTLTQTSCEYH